MGQDFALVVIVRRSGANGDYGVSTSAFYEIGQTLKARKSKEALAPFFSGGEVIWVKQGGGGRQWPLLIDALLAHR